ncbi:cleavage/polyadenylation factor ia subunit Clp1p [Coprinopsis sp. MPI-PUGE-AT-0042]|nr:cleavage/polyadenylation factor ia subunit Clp1p [Coprinopsis sp. MPI-PUGE-AT-0042]
MADSSTAPPNAPSKQWHLHPESEYRFELDPGTSLAIKLLRGKAEIDGAELVEGKTYLFALECKAAVFTWHGCTIEVTGTPSTEYISEETPMSAYANVHTALEQMRVRALCKAKGIPLPQVPQQQYGRPGGVSAAAAKANADPKLSEPPRVLVLGPENSGKTTVCKILVNYAVRTGQGWKPILVNVDPSEGGPSIPGTLSASPISSPIPTYSPASPLGSAQTTAPVSLASHSVAPLVSWYGHTDTKKNVLLLDRLVRNLGDNVRARAESGDEEARASGLIIDTPASFAASSVPADHRQRMIKACVDAFRINIILVAGHEKLNVEMQRAFGSYVTVVKIPKSGGVVELDQSYRERVRKYQLHSYMYGHPVQPPQGVAGATLGGENPAHLILSPSSTMIKFGDISIHRIGTDAMAPSSALPVNATRQVSELQPVNVNPLMPSSKLLGSVLAVMAPFNEDENERYDEEILDLGVVGFIYVTHLDPKNKKMTILSPNQGSVVGKTCVVGSIEYQDQ